LIVSGLGGRLGSGLRIEAALTAVLALAARGFFEAAFVFGAAFLAAALALGAAFLAVVFLLP